MSLEHTPPPMQPPPPLPVAPVSIEPSVCHVCNQTMIEGEDCLIINECSHAYHRICIENFLSSTSECPVCKRSCQLNELRKLVIKTKVVPNIRGKGRGALASRYNTRSSSRNLFQENSNNQIDSITTPERTPNRQGNVAVSSQDEDVQRSSKDTNSSTVNYEEINRMIEQNVTKLLQNLNMLPTPNINRSIPNDIPLLNSNQRNVSFSHNSERNRPMQNNAQNTNSPQTFLSYGSLNIDKVTLVIQNWNLKFDGTPTGLNVEEFLYRLRSLTQDYFNGDFSIICRNLHILLSGKARDWYWRYHKQVKNIEWTDFCEAIRCQYREFKSSFDIREEIRNRKQKPGESFDSFFEAISAISDRLSTSISELELIEIIAHNLRPEIRQDLLYIPVHSIPHLRKLVQMRENFLSEEHVKKNFVSRNPNQYFPKRVAEILDPTEANSSGIDDCSSFCVEAVHKQEMTTKCWNCDELGHHWEDCIQTRRIFCYGCGAKDIYKPNCLKCAARKQNVSKNLRTNGPQKDKV